MQAATLSARKLAIMVAHGFDETQFIEIQKQAMQSTAQMKVISATSGLVNSSSNGTMAMSYPVDANLSETLAIDYDALILIEGQHLNTLKDEPHAGRIIRAFLRAGMPVLSFGEAQSLVVETAEEVTADTFAALAPAGRDGAVLYADAGQSVSSVFRSLADAIADAEAAFAAEDAEEAAAAEAA